MFSTFAISFFFWKKKTCVSQIFCFLDVLSQKIAEREKTMISRNIFSIKNQMQVIPLSRNPRDKKKQTKEGKK